LHGDAEIGQAGILNQLNSHYDMTNFLWHAKAQYITRTPQPVAYFGNVFKPFSFPMWLSVIATVSTLATFLFLANVLYQSEQLRDYRISTPENSAINFFLFSFAKLTEPDPLPWFAKTWSTGKMLVLLWSIFSMFVVFFYSSNLRANMMTVEYEPKVETLAQILTRGQKVYMFYSAVVQARYCTGT
jgi:hypothetical protein